MMNLILIAALTVALTCLIAFRRWNRMTNRWKIGLLIGVWLVVAGTGAILFPFRYTGRSTLPSPPIQKAPATPAERIRTWAPTFNELKALVACDRAIKRQLLSPATFDGGAWLVLEHPKQARVTILRDYDSQNGFGALVRRRYHCLLSAHTNRVFEATP
jgi:hypothetical protein